MFDIKADTNKNLLVLRLEGFISDEELKTAANQCISEAGKLSEGFTVINDISMMKPASPVGAAEIKRAQAYIINNGVNKIIRVTQNPISKMQFNRTSGEVGYHAYEVRTIKEAYDMVEA